MSAGECLRNTHVILNRNSLEASSLACCAFACQLKWQDLRVIQFAEVITHENRPFAKNCFTTTFQNQVGNISQSHKYRSRRKSLAE